MINPAILAVMIPIVAIVMGVGIGMLSIYLKYRKRKEMFVLFHQQRMAALDKGIDLPDIPDAFFADDATVRSPRRDLLRGLVWFLVGGAAMAALYIHGETKECFFGLIPLAIGVAYLIYYFVEGRRPPEARPPADGKSRLAPSSSLG